MIKSIFMRFVPESIKTSMREREMAKELVEWEKNSRPAPPPHIIKQRIIQSYQQQSGYSVLIETGTYLGDMIEAQKHNFKKIISIELSEKLYKRAVKRFKNDHRIKIVQGDSGKVLPNIIRDLDEPAIFWLDGHYSAGITAKGEKECPIFEEIDAIFTKPNLGHVLLVDDARCFIGEGDYPTIPRLTEYIKSKDSRYTCHVENDVIRYTI